MIRNYKMIDEILKSMVIWPDKRGHITHMIKESVERPLN